MSLGTTTQSQARASVVTNSFICYIVLPIYFWVRCISERKEVVTVPLKNKFSLQILKFSSLTILFFLRGQVCLLCFNQHVLQVRWLLTKHLHGCSFSSSTLLLIIVSVCLTLWFTSLTYRNLLSLNSVFSSRRLKSLNTTPLVFGISLTCQVPSHNLWSFFSSTFLLAKLGIWTATLGHIPSWLSPLIE